MNAGAVIANAVWWLASLPDARRFRTAMRDVRGTQEALLHAILRANERTEYGQRYGFASIGSLSEYRRRVPPVQYEDLAPDIERMAAGEADVLVPGQPARFVPTSGSSGGLS